MRGYGSFSFLLETSWIIKGSVSVWFIIWQRTKWEKLSNEYEYVIVKLYQLGKLSQLDKLNQESGEKECHYLRMYSRECIKCQGCKI